MSVERVYLMFKVIEIFGNHTPNKVNVMFVKDALEVDALHNLMNFMIKLKRMLKIPYKEREQNK